MTTIHCAKVQRSMQRSRPPPRSFWRLRLKRWIFWGTLTQGETPRCRKSQLSKILLILKIHISKNSKHKSIKNPLQKNPNISIEFWMIESDTTVTSAKRENKNQPELSIASTWRKTKEERKGKPTTRKTCPMLVMESHHVRIFPLD